MSATFWLENLKVKDYSGDRDVDKRIILKWIVDEVYGCGLDSSSSGYVPLTAYSMHGNGVWVPLVIGNFFPV